MAGRVGSVGEPWHAFFGPETLARELRAMGYRDDADMGPDRIKAKYSKGRADELRVGSLAHVMHGQV